MNKYYINVNKDSEEYMWIYRGIKKQGNNILVEIEPLFHNDLYNINDLREIPEKTYNQILDCNFNGFDDEEFELKELALKNIGII